MLNPDITIVGILCLGMLPSLQACTLECSEASPAALQAVTALKKLTRAEVCHISFGVVVLLQLHCTTQCLHTPTLAPCCCSKMSVSSMQNKLLANQEIPLIARSSFAVFRLEAYCAAKSLPCFDMPSSCSLICLSVCPTSIWLSTCQRIYEQFSALQFPGCPLSPEFMSTVGHMTKLRFLSLSGQSIAPDDDNVDGAEPLKLEVLEPLTSLVNLEYLDMTNRALNSTVVSQKPLVSHIMKPPQSAPNLYGFSIERTEMSCVSKGSSL